MRINKTIFAKVDTIVLVWLRINKALFAKVGSGPDVAHRLPFADIYC